MEIKICGLSHPADIEMVNKLGPNYMGLVINYPKSSRSVDSNLLPSLVEGVTVPLVFLFVNSPAENILEVIELKSPSAIQLHGNESIEFIQILKEQIGEIEIWKALHLPTEKGGSAIEKYLDLINEYVSAGCQKIILDSSTKELMGGTGITCDWDLAANIIQNSNANIFLAGGLTSKNVQSAIQKVKPFGVDVSSGVEKSKSRKDEDKVLAFIKNARS